MSLKFFRFIDLPEHVKPGGFDHAAIHHSSNRLYVAHTINDALDVIDCKRDVYLHSIPNLAGVAGALVSDELDLVFTSNRGENTVGIFSIHDEKTITKVQVGIRPNGLAFDASRNLLLVANVGDPNITDSFTVSMVDITRHEMIASISVAGRTRWTVFDSSTNSFYVNIAQPAQIAVIDANNPACIARVVDILTVRPHGLDLDAAHGRLYCACDGGKLLVIDSNNGTVQAMAELNGVPDVIFLNNELHHLYVAIGDPGLIEVFHTEPLRLLESIPTEQGAHTIAFNAVEHKVYAFLPQTHRAAIFLDSE
jgi:DNA-binding beta-propeller fold protein YncE